MPQAVQIQSLGGTQPPGTPLVIDPTFNAARVSQRPLEYCQGGQVFGHYRVTMPFANTAAQAGPLVALRWAPGSNGPYFLLERIIASAYITTIFTTPQLVDLKATVARGFTVAATGGTAVALGGTSNQKNRVSMGSSLVSDLRYGNLTAGTRTLDALGFCGATINVLNVPPSATLTGLLPPIDLYKWDVTGQHPITLANNEGLEIAPITALGAAGIVQYYITLAWAEVLSF